MYYYGFEYFIYLIPGILLALYAQAKISSAYEKYGNINSKINISGAQAARKILDASGLYDVEIKMIGGRLTDNYNPSDKVLSLSKDVYENTSIASISIAAHEVGHAIQDKIDYKPLRFRESIVPMANLGSNLSVWFIIIGCFFSYFLTQIGVALFFFAVLFQIVTLPVEFDASRRAKLAIEDAGFLDQEEMKGTKEVLSAAALTYVGATLTAIGQFLRLLALTNGGRRRR
ncbi:zinc metallopeptidase [Peptoniphilus lacrimalis]|uniref:Putative neutral zinc metallopeptidase n=1 Tax=Peptoniphilus lacrimalis 315-B TaxID=596330 RepID=D1VSE4_9FIRM|nr:zinc metallopeptidase [Peptoniphilus lacrimalis]EFA90527.1 putative neutral zinc metallopeptidase [Peptoniphilus lacrimalis 315-B]MDK7722061.1 zinc metallopeptidase [Peptoniphilus lacrimalis]MDK7731693.1 zinc metallopeptidase [Peptoniphilus lacrimalis]